jgi:hypothetical protein
MDSTKQIARLAGVLYLLLVIGGVFSLMYVRGAVIVPGDAAATTERILDHATMLRIDLVVGQVSMVVFMVVALLLYQLLKHVHQAGAVVMALVVLVHLPQGLVTLLLQFGALEMAHGEGFLATLDPTQREIMATLCLHLVGKSAILSEFSWGLWLLPLGALVYRSGFLPRFLGIWLILNGRECKDFCVCRSYIEPRVGRDVWPNRRFARSYWMSCCPVATRRNCSHRVACSPI